MIDIEQEAIKTYELNMQYLKKNHPNLHKDLLSLDLEMQNGNIQQKFDLEYIEDNFDIKEIATGKYIYEKESNKIAQSYADTTVFDKDISTIESFSMLDLTDEKVKLEDFTIRARQYIYPMMTYSVKNIKRNSKMKEIVKYIFSGIGLGSHIQSIHNKIHGHRYLIIEDDIEIFKLSLFVTKYYEIAKEATIYFSVLEDETAFKITYDRYMQDAFMYNYLIKYTHLSIHSHVKLKQLISFTGSQTYVAYPYQLQLDRYLSPLKCINEKYPLIDIYKDIDDSILKNKPVLVIASGPSLSKNIEWLKQNHSKFIIMAVSSSLHFLDKHDIYPDLVLSADADIRVGEFFTNFKNKDFLNNTTIIFSSITHSDVLEKAKKYDFYISDISMQFNTDKPRYSFSCVGSFAYLYALDTSATNIYVLGLDLAVDQKTGEDHISEHMFSTKTDIANKGALPLTISLTETLIPLQGNFQETIYTTPSFHSSIFTIAQVASSIKKPYQNVYNVNHGAKIQASQALEISSVDVASLEKLNKIEFHNLFSKELNKNNNNTLNDKDLEIIKNNKIVIKKVKKLISKHSLKSKTSNYDIYIDRLLKLSENIYACEVARPVKPLITYKAYFEYVFSIMYTFFNTKDLTNIKQHIANFDKMILDGLNDITRQFEEVEF